MAGTRRLAVVIINYRTPDLACLALDSLAGQIDPARDVAVVVDNASGDGSPAKIAEWVAERGHGPWANVLASDRNGGFAAGNNLGIAAFPANLHLLLNSDARLAPGALAALLAAAQARPEAGLFVPRIEGEDGAPHSTCFRAPSPASELIGAAATGPLTRRLARYDVPLSPGAPADGADWISFACVLVRAEVFTAIGPMDEGYFLYYEDVDFCRRARAAGFAFADVPNARAIHRHGASTGVPTALAERTRAPAYLYDSRARYFTRFYGRRGLWLANLLWTLGRGISLARESLGSKPPHTARSEWRDIWRGRAGAGAALRERGTR